MTLQHEIFVSSEAQTHLEDTQHDNAHAEAHLIADAICRQKGWTRGLSCMVVMRDGRNGRTPYFVINQVLDTQTKVASTSDINDNTPSLNADAHCIMTIKGNGPNRYGGFHRLASSVRTGNITRRIV